jgi:hypothetical protein
MRTPTRSTERGMALVLVMLITVAVAALAAGAIFLTGSSYLISRGQEQEQDMRNAADAGIELGRSALNGNPALFPSTGYVTLFADQPVLDASGNPIPNTTRSIYLGPTGSSTGQYGIFGSVLSVINNRSGAVVVRRGELSQESFAKFAYYTDDEGSGICFGGMDQIYGPLHTNDNMCIYSSGARFRSAVEVSGTISGRNYGIFDQGYIEHGAVIPLPSMAALATLATYATQGGMNFTAPSGGSTTQARLRIEFVALDLDGDGRVTGPNEGFFRVYVDSGANDADYVTGTPPAFESTNNNYKEKNCGDFHGGVFYSAAYHYYIGSPPGSPSHSGTSTNKARQALAQGNARCYLGGDDHLNLVGGVNTFVPADSLGYWIRYTATPDPAVVAGLKNLASNTVDTTLAARQLEAQYLWPLSRQYNPNTKGVIYVNGRVLLSGVVHARVTVAASDNIIIGDDLQYAIQPGTAQCAGADILGMLSADSIYMSDNVLNTPQPWGSTGGYMHYASTNDEFLQGVLLTLNSFSVERYNYGPNTSENCGGTQSGRGCLYITGGVIQGTRGAVGQTNGNGYVKRYAYDQCAFETPPPYYPTTGRFFRNRYYEIDPVGFSVAGFFSSLTPNP